MLALAHGLFLRRRRLTVPHDITDGSQEAGIIISNRRFCLGVVQSNESSAKVDDLVASNAAPTEGSADAEDDKKAAGEMGSEEKPSKPTTTEAPQQEEFRPFTIGTAILCLLV
ncbi:hypothetical protein GUJ93_ZPchr0005g16090 [Zizania palustris]|uniref:Uncharacterized protein n=1 Tax=Zizania palustris TaxID=103762 RepID=A0A8J5VR98_ZIZPA|nr:hypothetical protein GUJ93_ZPchr0005g16090 [Zizania palustris]